MSLIEVLQSFIFNSTVSAVIGVLASLLVWWLPQHYWVSAVTFADELALYELPNGRFLNQCTFRNSGKRDMIDLEIVVRLSIFGFGGSEIWANHEIRSNTHRVPILAKGERRLVRLFDEREPIEFVTSPSQSLRLAIEKCATLKEILSLGVKSHITIHVFAYDKFSGVRKLFSSKKYSVRDIRRGRYAGLNVVQNTRVQSYRAYAASSPDD